MGDRRHSSSPNYDPGSSPPAAPHSSAVGASPERAARSPSDRRGYSRSASRSRSQSRSRSRSTSRRKPSSRSRSPGRRQSPRRYTRPVCGNYGVAGGNPNPRMPVVDVLTRFPMTCLFWKTNSCVKGAEKCSYIHGFVCRNDLHCNRKGCSDVHIKATRLSFQSGSRGYMKPGRGGYMRGGGRGGRGYGSYHGFGRDGRRGNFRDAGYGAGGGRQYHGGRDGSRGRGGSYERRSSREREAYRRDSADRRPPGEGDRGRWSRERPLSRTRSASSSSSSDRSRDRSRSRGRRTLSRSPKRRSPSKSSDRSSSSTEASRSRSHSRRRSHSSEKKKKSSHEVRSNGMSTLKKARRTAAAASVDPQKVASMFKDDMDLSQETIEKLLEAVGSASKSKGKRRSPSPQQRDKEPAFNDNIGSPYEEECKSSDGSGTSPPMRPPPPPPPPPKVTASDLDSVIPPPYRALKSGGDKNMWTPMMERVKFDSRPVEPGLSRWEIETPYLTRKKDSEAAAGRPGLSPPPRAAARPPPTAKGISSELETLFSRTFDNRYKEPVSKNDKEEKSLETKPSVDTLDVSEDEDRESKFAPAQGTGEALNWLMRKRQEGGEGEAVKPQGVISSRKRIRSESSESSSEGSEDDKPELENSVREEKTASLSNTKASFIQRKTSILKNMKMLMEQKTRLDAQKEELSRNHRGSDDVLQGILNENTVLNEEITKQIQNMCALVDEINKSLEDLDEVQGKSKSKKNKKKKTRKKHKKEKRHRQSHQSDDENKSSKHEKFSKSSKLEKEEFDEEESNGHQSMLASGSPVVAPRYWDIVKPLSVADTEAVNRSPSPLYEPREEYKKDYHRDRKEHEGREYEEYGADKRRLAEKRERSYEHNRRGEYHGRGAAADDHEAEKYNRDYEQDRRVPIQTRLHDARHNKQEDSVKAEGRFLRRSSSPGVERRESRKLGSGMYADKLDGVPAEPPPTGVKSSAEKGKMDAKEAARQVKASQKQGDDKPVVSKEELLKRITTMQFKHPERVRKRHLSTEDKKIVDAAVEDEVKTPIRETKQEGNSEFIDQGMHWCRLCNMFYDTLPQYLDHLVQDAHLLKLKDDAKSWLTAPPAEEKDLAALTRPLQGVEFVHSISSFYCELCCRHFSHEEAAANHVHAAEHVNAYKNHIQENPLYESSFFKDKMNAYAKFMMGQNQVAPTDTPAMTAASAKKKRRAFLGERNGSDAVAFSALGESGATKAGAECPAILRGSADNTEDTTRPSSAKKLLPETSSSTPNRRSAAAEQTPTSTRSGVRASERTPSSSNSRSRRDSVGDTKSSARGSRSPKRSGTQQKSDGKSSSSRETSIRVVARAFGGLPKVDEPKIPVEEELSATDEPEEPSELDYSGHVISDSVDSFVNKLDENDKIIEELKKKVACRIQEKRQAQSQREEEEARSREEEEKDARKKLEAKLDKLARPKPVVGQRKSHSRFPLIGKMPFFKTKPIKSLTGKGKDKGASTKQKDASDSEQSSLNISMPDLDFQDIEDPKFLKVSSKGDGNDSQDDEMMFEEGSIDFDSEETSGEYSMVATGGSKLKTAAKCEAEQSADMKAQLKRMRSMTKIKKDKVESQRVPQVIEKLTSFIKEDGAGAGTDMFEHASSVGKKKSTSSEGIIIPGEKTPNSKQKNQKIPKTKKQKAIEEADAPLSVNKKLPKEKTKSTGKLDAIGPVLPLAIPLPVAVSTSSSCIPTTTIDLKKLPPGYPKFLGTSSSTLPPQFSVTSFPSKSHPSDNPMSSSFSPSQMTTYGFPSSHLIPFTTAGSVPSSVYPPFLNTSGSPMTGKCHDSLNTSSGSSAFEVGSISTASKAPIASIPDFTTLFSQPPPMLLRTPPAEIGLQTSSPRVAPPSTGHQTASPPKREATPPPPGTEVANSRPPAGEMIKDPGQNKTAFDAEEDLLPPGVEPDEVEAPGVQKGKKTASFGSSSYDPNGHNASTQMNSSAYSSPFSANAASKASFDLGKSFHLGETTDVDAANEILAHAIPTRAQIDSRLIAAGQLSPSALVEDESKRASIDLG